METAVDWLWVFCRKDLAKAHFDSDKVTVREFFGEWLDEEVDEGLWNCSTHGDWKMLIATSKVKNEEKAAPHQVVI